MRMCYVIGYECARYISYMPLLFQLVELGVGGQSSTRYKVCPMAELESEASEEDTGKEFNNRSPYNLPLPSRIVQVISEEEIGGRDLLIVGDVHGCCMELKEMLDTHNIKKENTCVLFVGDLTNKGPYSIEVVQLVMENGWYSVRGNHDEVSLHEYTQSKLKEPCGNFEWVAKLQKQEVEWLLGLPYALHIPSRQIIVVHAGLLPAAPLCEQTPNVFLHIKCVQKKGDKWVWTKKFDESQKLWGEVWSGPEHVYYGHDARRLFRQFPFATALDTACVYGIELTAIYPLSKRVLKVKAHQNYKKKSYFDTSND